MYNIVHTTFLVRARPLLKSFGLINSLKKFCFDTFPFYSRIFQSILEYSRISRNTFSSGTVNAHTLHIWLTDTATGIAIATPYIKILNSWSSVVKSCSCKCKQEFLGRVKKRSKSEYLLWLQIGLWCLYEGIYRRLQEVKHLWAFWREGYINM